jgi:hypothetical protein
VSPAAEQDRYAATVYLQPATVNFSRVRVYESEATAVKSGYWLDKPVQPHNANGPTWMDDYIEGKGTRMAGEDMIGGFAGPPPWSDGIAYWPIQ